jgi:hypothetical protein
MYHQLYKNKQRYEVMVKLFLPLMKESQRCTGFQDVGNSVRLIFLKIEEITLRGRIFLSGALITSEWWQCWSFLLSVLFFHEFYVIIFYSYLFFYQLRQILLSDWPLTISRLAARSNKVSCFTVQLFWAPVISCSSDAVLKPIKREIF